MLVLKKTRIAVDVNGWRHKVFVRWLSCSINDEVISVHAYDTVPNSASAFGSNLTCTIADVHPDF
nr:hypothetical protein K4M19_00136 [Agrobacterium fabrum]